MKNLSSTFTWDWQNLPYVATRVTRDSRRPWSSDILRERVRPRADLSSVVLLPAAFPEQHPRAIESLAGGRSQVHGMPARAMRAADLIARFKEL